MYTVEVLSVQVQMLGHAALKKKQLPLEPQHHRTGRKIYFKAYSIFSLEQKFVAPSGHIHTNLFTVYQLKLAAQIAKRFSIYWNSNLVSNSQA